MIKVFETDNSCVTYCNENTLDVEEMLAGKSVIVLLSGGIDSQAVSLYFKHRNIEHINYFFDYKFNKYDKQYADLFEHETLSLDLDELYFEKKIHLKYFEKCKCTSPQLAVHLYGVDFLREKYPNYVFIMPGMPFFYNKNDDNTIANSLPDYTQLSYYRYTKTCNVEFYPYFWIQFDPLNKIAIDKIQSNFNISDYQKKIILYNNLGLKITPQERKKTGFEEYKDYLKNEKQIDYNKTFRQPISYVKPSIGVISRLLLNSNLKQYIGN
jgi:hypothetical protein